MASSKGRGRRFAPEQRERILKRVGDLTKKGWSERRIASELKIAKGLVGNLKREIAEAAEAKAEAKKPIRISHLPVVRMDLPRGIVHRFIVTSAQDDTPAFEPLVANIESYAAFCGAEIIIGPGTYQKGLFQDHAVEAGVYDSRIAAYIRRDRIQVTDDLLIVTAANVMPTTANPLQGFQTANGGGHVIVPHARVALQSIPRLQGQPPRYAISTGTVTLPNYIPRAAGQKALPHHTFGFTMVEVDTDGEIFLRPVIASQGGSFQDLDVFVKDGVCHPDRRVKAISWGDIHHEQLNREIALASWGYDTVLKTNVGGWSILDTLRPDIQFLHDTVDFRRRNHHGLNDPHERARVQQASSGNVEQEVAEAAWFVNHVRRDWCRTVMVESNHDAALGKWLKNPEGAMDAENAYFWHEMNAAWHRAIRAAEDSFNVVEHGMRLCGLADDVEFVKSGGSYLVGRVQCGMHGDLGMGGRPGSPNQFKRFGVETSTGHTHSPFIADNAFVAGVSAELDQGYNRGPTTWAHAHIVQYFNGKRTLLLMTADGRHRAIGDRLELAQAA